MSTEIDIPLSDAAAIVGDGATIALGGLLLENRPSELVRELIRNGRKDLTYVSSPVSGWDLDVLMLSGLLARAFVGHVSLGPLGLAPAFSGRTLFTTDVIWCDEAALIGSLMAAADGIPSRLVSSIHANDVTAANPLVRWTHPSGVPEVSAMSPDVALLHAPIADRSGNLHYRSSRFADAILAAASQSVIATVDRLVNETPNDVKATVPGYLVDAVVVQPEGSWPSGVAGERTADFGHLTLYRDMVRGGEGGAYLDRYVLEVTK